MSNLLKIEVALDDLWCDTCEESIEESLASSIKSTVIQELRAKYEEETKKRIDLAVVEFVKTKLDFVVSGKMDELLNSADFKVKDSNYSSANELSIDDLVEKYVRESLDEGKLVSAINKKMTDYIEGLHERYDMMFAASVVKALNEQKMLKDENVTKLLNE